MAKDPRNICDCNIHPLSQTRKLITQIDQVGQKIRSIKINKSTSTVCSQLGSDHTSKGPQLSTYEKGEKDCACSRDSRTYDNYEDPHNSQNNPAHHAGSSPHTLPPSTLPSPTFSHASSEASSSSTTGNHFLLSKT